MMKGLFNFMVGSPSRYVTSLPSLLTMDNVAVEMYKVAILRPDLVRPRDQRVM